MSTAKRKFVIVLPPILTVPSCSLSASAIFLSREMLTRRGEGGGRKHPWHIPLVVRNHSQMLLSW